VRCPRDELIHDPSAVCHRRDVGQYVDGVITDRLDQVTPYPRQRLHLRLQRHALNGRHVDEHVRHAVGEGAIIKVVADLCGNQPES
jgi:hypothetical protein